MPLLYAGLDRSGSPDLSEHQARNQLYGVGIAAVEDREVLHQELQAALYTHHRARTAEVHGHESPEKTQAAVLEAGIRCGMRVGIYFIDREATRQCFLSSGLPSPKAFMRDTGLLLIERFVEKHCLGGLWCDEDVPDKGWQREFDTQVKRIHRIYWPAEGVKVRHIPSHQSDLIQLADVCLYGFSRLMRGAEQRPELRRVLRQLQEEEQNVVLEPVIWGNIAEEA
jgi:hypothetical protein